LREKAVNYFVTLYHLLLLLTNTTIFCDWSIFKRARSHVFGRLEVPHWFVWTIILGFFGLGFGFLFVIPYYFISPSYAFSYWLAGIPWDILHCAGNVLIAATIGKPIYKALVRIEKNSGQSTRLEKNRHF